MIMQTVGIHDTLVLTRRPEGGIVLRTDSSELGEDKDNLICRAAKLMQEEFSLKEGVEITLTKRIPVAAGMAGGSTDAAATLAGMNRLFALDCGSDKLKALGVKLGADVPYCIEGGTALSEGIGEALTALPPAPDCFVAVVKPDISVSTKYVYEHLHVDKLEHHPNIDGMAEAIRQGDLQGVCSRMENVLETVTQKEYPVIAKLKETLLQAGAMNALMSGSGPTVFGIFDREDTAAEAIRQIQKSGMAKQSFVTVFTAGSQIEE
jgi:4-diphosphocytidyl-2-C-methyl-D-erythritol kinase